MISSVDKDGTGSIDFREFLILMSDQMKSRNKYSNDNSPRELKEKLSARQTAISSHAKQDGHHDRLNLSELEDLNARDSTFENPKFD